MRTLIITLMLAMAPPLFADEAPSYNYELELRPNVGYSAYEGLSLGTDLVFRLPVGDHWQWQVGAGATYDKYNSGKNISTGWVYNFSAERSDSFFLGAGLAYGNDLRMRGSANALSSYLEVGKRFALNKTGTITWNPSVTVQNDSNQSFLTARPLNIGWNF